MREKRANAGDTLKINKTTIASLQNQSTDAWRKFFTLLTNIQNKNDISLNEKNVRILDLMKSINSYKVFQSIDYKIRSVVDTKKRVHEIDIQKIVTESLKELNIPVPMKDR